MQADAASNLFTYLHQGWVGENPDRILIAETNKPLVGLHLHMELHLYFRK